MMGQGATTPGAGLRCLECDDSPAQAQRNRELLDINRDRAKKLGRGAVDAIREGCYRSDSGQSVDWSAQIARARELRRSIPPHEVLDVSSERPYPVTEVRVRNTTTLEAAKDLVDRGERPLALNFANGVAPGGGFLNGARAQEEVLCRSSALFATLDGDPMYDSHRLRPEPDSSDWVLLSPEVPVFRDDSGAALDEPWLIDVITSAAPVATRIGQSRARDLLKLRIYRVMEVAAAYSYRTLLLGAWGCGAFGNDPGHTANDFRCALEQEFRGCFAIVEFAITDWSEERKFLGPFRDCFVA